MKNIETKIVFMLATTAAILFLPWLGSYFLFHGNFPADFYAYPPLKAMEKPGFSMPLFLVGAFVCAVITCIYVFPKWFGFKKSAPEVKADKPKGRLPYWFWVGTFAWAGALYLLSMRVNEPMWLIHLGDLPLFWGAVLMLDGWVYYRNNGVSLVSKFPHELVGIGMCSISGWMIFEFLNFFVEDNWYYPCGDILDREEFLLYACIISSGLLPLSFEWYCVFQTFPNFKKRFSNGIKITLNAGIKNVLFVLSLASMFASGYIPEYFFWAIWLSPTVILAIALDKIGVWTPLNTIGTGNWSPTLLSGLTYFVAGFTLECQNYFTAIHSNPVKSYDPAYWQYSLPYVDVLHVFEMPLLGLYGYLPFGVYCWLWWIMFATVLNIPARFLKEDPLKLD